MISEIHPGIGESMVHVDLTSEPRLERMLAELRSESSVVSTNENDPNLDASTTHAAFDEGRLFADLESELSGTGPQ